MQERSYWRYYGIEDRGDCPKTNFTLKKGFWTAWGGLSMIEKYKIKQALVHITYSCEHHCPMCYANSDTNKEQPSLEQLCKVIDRLLELGINDITLVGGDPAIYRYIVELVAHAKKNGAILSVLSNTLDFNGRKNDVLEYIDVYEGTIHHSDSLKHDSFCGVEGAYEKLINNLSFFSEKGKSVGLALNIIPYNYSVLEDLVEAVMKRGVKVDHIIMQRIIQFGRASGMDSFEISGEMLNEALRQVDSLQKKYEINVVFEDPFPLCAMDEKYFKYMRPCECGISKITVDYEGNLSRCGADVFHLFGSVFDDVNNLWNIDASLKTFREKKYLPSKCHKCKLFGQCGGGCPISRNPERGFTVDYLSNSRGQI